MFKSKGKAKVDLTRAVKSSEQSQSLDLPPAYQRQELRRAVRKGLWCVCTISTDAANLREAIILDVSKTGARIRFRSKGTLPNIVRIKASRIGLNRYARVVWQSTFDAGIEFVPDAQVQPRTN